MEDTLGSIEVRKPTLPSLNKTRTKSMWISLKIFRFTRRCLKVSYSQSIN